MIRQLGGLAMCISSGYVCMIVFEKGDLYAVPWFAAMSVYGGLIASQTFGALAEDAEWYGWAFGMPALAAQCHLWKKPFKPIPFAHLVIGAAISVPMLGYEVTGNVEDPLVYQLTDLGKLAGLASNVSMIAASNTAGNENAMAGGIILLLSHLAYTNGTQFIVPPFDVFLLGTTGANYYFMLGFQGYKKFKMPF